MRSKLGILIAAAVAGGLSGCYGAKFDPTLEEVYACESDDDCSETFACVSKVCIDTDGPTVAVLGPEEFQKFAPPMGGEQISIILSGEALILTEPGGANVEGEGHVDVLLDGELVETLVSGSLAGNPSTMLVDLPSEPGVHRITAIARQNDGTRYKNPSASETIAFWIDDGQPHVGLRRPVPDTVYVADPDTNVVAADIDIVSINFDLLNPSNVPIDQQQNLGQGHVHVIFNRGVPECIPSTDCNDVYVAAVFPADDSRVKRISPSPNPLPLPPSPPGTYQLAIVAEFSDHQPYPSDEADAVVYDAIEIQIVED